MIIDILEILYNLKNIAYSMVQKSYPTTIIKTENTVNMYTKCNITY